ncbi:recombinase A [compost metagenome]
MIDTGVAGGAIERSGTWLAFDGTKIGQGREKARQFLRENPDVLAKIEARIREAGAPVSVAGEPAAAAAD